MRTWTQPEGPTDVQAVRDSTGDLWRRTGGGQWGCAGQEVDAWTQDIDDWYCSWVEVMRYAPLREVTQECEARAAIGPVHITDEAVMAAERVLSGTGAVLSATPVARAIIAAVKALGFQVQE